MNTEINMQVPIGGETEVRQKMVVMVADFFDLTDVNKIMDSTKFIADLGADSLDCVELTMMFEDEFKIEIPDEQTEYWHTFGQTFKGVWELITQQGGRIPSLEDDPMAHIVPKVAPASNQPDNLVVPSIPVPKEDRNEQDSDTYQQGYDLGKRNGIRRRTRLFREGDENKPEYQRQYLFIEGYNDGYRAGRKDYKK